MDLLLKHENYQAKITARPEYTTAPKTTEVNPVTAPSFHAPARRRTNSCGASLNGFMVGIEGLTSGFLGDVFAMLEAEIKAKADMEVANVVFPKVVGEE